MSGIHEAYKDSKRKLIEIALMLGFCLIISVGALIYIFTDGSRSTDAGAALYDPCGAVSFLPSQADIQQALVDRGYDLRVDGVVGPDTRTAWDEAYRNQEASRWDFMYGDEK